MISHGGAPQRLEADMSPFVLVMNATHCRTSVDFAFIRMATDSIAQRRPRFALAF